jgi:hypothetical protein
MQSFETCYEWSTHIKEGKRIEVHIIGQNRDIQGQNCSYVLAHKASLYQASGVANR